MKRNLKSLFAAGAIGMFGVAHAADQTVTSNVGFISDYTFRGISQNFRSPSLQGGFDYTHSSGLFAGTWASNISGNQYTNASMEWDVYGGYNGAVSDDLIYSTGLNYAMYPNGKTQTTSPSKKWDTAEVNVGATFKGINLKYTYALTDWYGIASSANGGFEPTLWANSATTADAANANLGTTGSNYVELNYTYTLAQDIALMAHAGRQTVTNFSLLSYTDYKLGISKPYAGFTFGLAYTTTNATDNTLYHVVANGDNRNLRGGILALNASRTF